MRECVKERKRERIDRYICTCPSCRGKFGEVLIWQCGDFVQTVKIICTCMYSYVTFNQLQIKNCQRQKITNFAKLNGSQTFSPHGIRMYVFSPP